MTEYLENLPPHYYTMCYKNNTYDNFHAAKHYEHSPPVRDSPFFLLFFFFSLKFILFFVFLNLAKRRNQICTDGNL